MPLSPRLLYDLALAARGSLAPQAVWDTFSAALAEHLGVDAAAVWLDGDDAPAYRHGDALARPEASGARGPAVGTAVFRLEGVGTLAMRSPELDAESVADLSEVVEAFGRSFGAASAHDTMCRQASRRLDTATEHRLAGERLAALIRTSPAAVLVENAERHVTLANQSFCTLFGIPAPPEALVGMDCAVAAEETAQLFADPQAFLDGVDRLLAARETVTAEPLALADGRILERDYVPILLDGDYEGHLWEYRDVTDRHQTATALDELREFYESILESMPAQLASFAPDGRYLYVTPSAIRDPEVRKAITGLTDEDYALIRGLPPEVPRKRMQTIRDVAASQEPVEFEESFRTREGEMRHFVRFVSPVLDDEGRTAQVLGYGLDITDRKKAENALAASEALKRGLFETALDAVLTIDREGRLVEFNPAAEQTFGFDAEDVIGEVMADLIIPHRFREGHARGMAHYLATGEGPVLGKRIELFAIRADGSEFPIELAINPVQVDEEREVFTATVRDITERKAAEDALRKSEARLRLALDVADLGTWDRTPEGEGDWDARCRSIFGVPEDGPLAFDVLRERIHPDDRDEVDRRLAHAFTPESEGAYEAEYRVVWDSGEIRWVSVRGLVLFDEATQEAVRFVGTAQDVTEQHHAAEALEASERRYKQLVEHSQDVIYRADLSGVFTFANVVATRLTGYDESDLLGMPFWDLVAPEHRAETVAFYARQVADREPNTYLEFPVITASGETLWFGQNVQLIEEDGEVVGIQALARNVTDRRRVMDELVLARETAERAMRAREEFLANMSHEMRTPLNAVIGMGALLRETELNGEQRHFLQALSFSAEQLLALINDLLDVAKIESGQIQFERVPFHLREVVDGVADAVRFRAEEKGLDMQIEVDETVPGHLVGDSVRLSQILLNLLSNAVKFTERGRVELRVSPETSAPEAGGDGRAPEASGERVRLQIEVEDTGVGIPADKVAAVFERFSQARTDTTRRFGGTGLGLAIVKELTERQGGTVEVTSREGRGSCFTVTLEFAIAHDAPEAHFEEEADLGGSRILLVEDNALNQFVARRMLESWGATVDVAENGREGVEAVHAASGEGDPFGLVLMDIQMPEMDGFEATRRIRETFGSDALPILALTASALVEQRDQMDEAGMDGLLLKPFKPEHLRRTVAAFLGRGGAPPEAEAPESLVDLSTLEDNVEGDQEFIRRVVELFVDLVPEIVTTLEVALASDDLPAIATAAHKLKSSAGILGATGLHAALDEIETLAMEGQPARLPTLIEAAIGTAGATIDELHFRFPFDP
ncbi:PAS domain S-box protein [Rubricoccus marinus]|uniref:Sensory/regulatory protein RpfC n=1 Tax=Rubricoccus marinus TaxID=716817 RepID=A0A259TV31_9BACT|nr:PAS domain S-box protein [Rubricoccus marinus]OZC01556.1 hypothetical protein BSZ36_00285 [Rubricoccus marinus]